MRAYWLLAAALALTTSASAQSIFKCKEADGRTTYSSKPCAGEGVTLPITTQGRSTAVNTRTVDSAFAQRAEPDRGYWSSCVAGKVD